MADIIEFVDLQKRASECFKLLALSSVHGRRKIGTAGLLKNPVKNYAVIYKLLSEKGYFSPKLVKALKIYFTTPFMI